MRLASWTFLLMFVTHAVQGFDDESILGRLAEEEAEIDARHRPHQQLRGDSGIRGGKTPVSSPTNPPAHPALVPEWILLREEDYESPGSTSPGRKGRGRTADGVRQSSPPPHAVATDAEPRRASTTASSSSQLPSLHLFPSTAPVDDRRLQSRRQKTSRGRSSGSRGMVAHSVCPSQTEWKRLREATDINNTVVEVFQPPSHGSQRKRGGRGEGGRGEGGEMARWTPQWFYVVSCRNQVFQAERQCLDCCIGIDHSRFASSCEQRQSYVLAYIRRPWQRKFSWDYILINSGCNCAITSIHEDL